MSDPRKTDGTPDDLDPAQRPTPPTTDVPIDATQPRQAAIPAQPGVTQSAAPTPAAAPARPASSSSPTRGTVRTVHYNLSYIVRNESAGPRGAVVLLHDLPGGAFTWQDALPALDAT